MSWISFCYCAESKCTNIRTADSNKHNGNEPNNDKRETPRHKENAPCNAIAVYRYAEPKDPNDLWLEYEQLGQV